MYIYCCSYIFVVNTFVYPVLEYIKPWYTHELLYINRITSAFKYKICAPFQNLRFFLVVLLYKWWFYSENPLNMLFFCIHMFRHDFVIIWIIFLCWKFTRAKVQNFQGSLYVLNLMVICFFIAKVTNILGTYISLYLNFNIWQ